MLSKCPLLFWTVIITASRHSTSYSYLYDSLRAGYEDLLAKNMIKVIRSVAQLHAILILVMWPLPYPGPMNDPSWGYCGLALNAALQMGMHRPGFHREYGFPDLTQEQVQLRTVTWMMAFQTSIGCVFNSASLYSKANDHRVSTFLGIPPFIDASPHMDAILAKPTGLPKVMVAQTDIQLHVARFTLALDGVMEPSSKAIHLNMFERELERLRSTFEPIWTGDTELNIIGAKLYLYGHLFVARKSEDSSMQNPHHLIGDSSSRRILYSGLAAAVSYIHSFSELQLPESSPMSPETPSSASPLVANREWYYPHHYWKNLCFASFFLLKFLAVASDATEADQELARNHLTTAYNIFMGYPNNKEAVGVAKTIELLVQTNAIQAEGKVATRLGASIIYDSLLTFSQLEKARHAGKLDMSEQEHPAAVQTVLTPVGESFESNFSLADFLNADWNLAWETNFFDMGMDIPNH